MILFDILPVFIKGKFSILKNMLNRINRLINKNVVVKKKFKINEINKILHLLSKK